MAAAETEHVLVVPTALFHEIGHFQGFCAQADRYLGPLLRSGEAAYRPRPEMEADPSFKQLIPYVIFSYRDSDGRRQLFQYTRGGGQGESRLHAKVSIGIGGHISSEDGAPGDEASYEEGMRRELSEEVRIDTPYQQHCVGLINDDETEVGRVHLGVVHLFEVEQPQVHSNETDILSAGFRSLAELRQDMDRMETWSSICLQALFGDA